MRGLLLLTTVLTLSLSGCLSDEPGPTTDSVPAEDPVDPADPYHVDETVDLAPAGADASWSWEMTEGMNGNVLIEYTPNPASGRGPGHVCWRLEWPEGAHYGGTNCGNGNVGNVAVQVSGTSTISSSTLYENRMVPNSFDLHVWTSAPDTALVRVVVDTYAAPQ